MLHLIRRPLLALSASIALSVLALAWWVAVLNAGPPSAASGNSTSKSANISGPLYCSNWDFLNSTGQEVNDLHIRLKSVPAVTAVYTGALNPFGAPSTSGYDAGNDVYIMNFTGVTVSENDRVHIGFCSYTPLLRLGTGGTSFEWTLDGTPVQPNPLFTGVEWSWATRSHLQVKVVNEQPITMTLMTLQLLSPGPGIALEDLSAPVVDALPMVLDLLPVPQTMGPNAEHVFDAYFDDPAGVPPDHARILAPPYQYVLQAVLASENDPSDTTNLFAQSAGPFLSTNLPIINR